MKLNLKEILNDTNQLTRITVLAAVVLVLALISFGGYYYFDRYYSNRTEPVQQGLAQAEQAVRDDPQNKEKRLNLANGYLALGRFNEAITQANQLLNGEPNNHGALLVVGLANASSGKPGDAIEPLSIIFEARKKEDMPGLDKGLMAAAYYLGDSYLQLGKPDSAIEPLEALISWDTTDADAMYKLGLAYSGIKEYDRAITMFQRTTTFVPNYLAAYEALAVAYEANKQPDLAGYARGMSAYSRKDYKAALELLLKAAQAQPGFAPTFSGMGMTYEKMGDLQNAKSSFEAALLLAPNDFTANQGIKRIEAELKK
jgi:tetratricopeptide (TPR) repeat protein